MNSNPIGILIDNEMELQQTYLDVPPQSQEAGFEEQDEDFFDVLKKVSLMDAQVAPHSLQAGIPFLGPQGAKIAGALGTAISAAKELAKMKAPGTESEFEPPLSYRYHAARAVLAEATLQHVIRHGLHSPNQLVMFKAMQRSFEENQAQIRPVAKQIGPYLFEPALRIVVADTASKTGAEASSMDPYPRIRGEGVSDVQNKAFVQALNKAARSKGGEEDFLDFLNPLASQAVNVVDSGIGAVAKAIGGGKSSLPAGPTPPETLQAHMETLCHRALMGEAALKAAMAIPAASHEEGFFGDLVDTIKDIGGTVIKVAPAFINAVTRVVKSLTESSTPVPTDGQTGPSGKPLVKLPPIADLASDGLPPPTPATAPNVPDAPSVADIARSGESFKGGKEFA